MALRRGVGMGLDFIAALMLVAAVVIFGY